MRQHRTARERPSYLMNPRASNSAIGTTTQRAKVVAMLFSDAVKVEEEVPVEGEVELVAGGVDDGGGGADVGLVDIVGEVLEVPDDLVELANVQASLDLALQEARWGGGTQVWDAGSRRGASLGAGQGNGPTVVYVASQPGARVLDALLEGESVEVSKAVIGAVIPDEFSGGLRPDAGLDEPLDDGAVAGREVVEGNGAFADESARDTVVDQVNSSPFLVVHTGQEATPQEFAVGGVQAFFDLGRLVVDVGEGDELPELHQFHRPTELALAPDVYEAVERLGQRVMQAEVEVGIQAFEVVGIVGAYEDLVELERMALATRTLLALLALEVHAPRAETMRLEVLIFVVVESVLGVDDAVRNPVEAVAYVVVVLARPWVLAHHTQQPVYAEADPAVCRHSSIPMDVSHYRYVRVTVRWAG